MHTLEIARDIVASGRCAVALSAAPESSPPAAGLLARSPVRHGNTHFPMSDLNNVQIADLLSKVLADKKLD